MDADYSGPPVETADEWGDLGNDFDCDPGPADVDAIYEFSTPVEIPCSRSADGILIIPTCATWDQQKNDNNWVFDDLSGCDERSYMDPLVERFCFETIRIPGDDCWPLEGIESWPRDPSTPETNPYQRLKDRLFRAVAASGTRVLLTGTAGDHLYTGSERWLLSLLSEHGLGAAKVESGGFFTAGLSTHFGPLTLDFRRCLVLHRGSCLVSPHSGRVSATSPPVRGARRASAPHRSPRALRRPRAHPPRSPDTRVPGS